MRLKRFLRGARFASLRVLDCFHASSQVIRHRDGFKDGLTDLGCVVLGRFASLSMLLVFEEHVSLVLELVQRILFLLRQPLCFK